jgi:uncharacterized membrane protein
MTMGPVQLLVVGFAGGEFKGEIMAELDRLRENDIVRLIDLIVVRKDEDGTVERVQRSDLSTEEAEEFGAVVGALIGFGLAGEEGAELGAVEGAAAGADGHVFDDEVWFVDDSIPPGTAAAVALLEHRWAVGLRDGIRNAGGFHLADAWVHPADLVGIGLIAAADAEAQLAKS